MKNKKNIIYLVIIIVLTIILGLLWFLIIKGDSNSSTKKNSTVASNVDLNLDMSNWSYDSTNNVYYQIGLYYVSNPVSEEYETLGIYVPGDYMDCTKDGETYTCILNKEKEVNGYTSETAPIVMPVNTPGYSAQSAPTSYSYNKVSSYLEEGFIYVHAGCRGRNNGDSYEGGAPWGVTDLKAAIRYLRYNSDSVAGDTESIFVFGHSGGGAQSSILGASGDSKLYTDYLNEIGAAMTDKDGNKISDAVKGVMAWCPITSLDYANQAYEWNMGQYYSSGTRADSTWTSALSDDLAEAYAKYINELKLIDENGNTLKLSETSDGIYTSGTYYDYLKGVIEKSLTNYLNDNYSSTSEMQKYVDSLNSDETWVTFNSNSKSVTITSIEAFVTHCKKASKNVVAFDYFDRSKAENALFGNSDNDYLHWDKVTLNILKDNESKYSKYSDYTSYISDYENDIKNTDSLGNDTTTRQNMYNPMYYLSDYYDGYQTSSVAKYWRIRSGITQGDTALTVETNLALALNNYKGVSDVDFETVWNQGHTEAERTGKATANFISWVNECMK